MPLLGIDLEAIDQAEERIRFAALLDRLGIPQPEGGMAHSVEEALTLAERIGYPVIVRPSFVIGGLAIDFCYSPEDLVRQLATATVVDPDRPVRIDRYLEGVEVDVDAISDGDAVLIPGLLEHVERAGVHSGDSGRRSSRRRRSSEGDQDLIVATMERIVLALGAQGLVNAQFIVRDDGVYLIEVNPRASRTVPFMSKVTGVPMVELAVRISLGETLRGDGLGRTACWSRRRSWRSRPRHSPPRSSAAWTRPSARACSPPARSSASTRTRGSPWPRRSWAPRSSRPGPGQAGALALLSIADRDKALLPRLASGASPTPATGWRRRRGPGSPWPRPGHEARPVAKLGEAADDGRRRDAPSWTSSRAARSASSSTPRRRVPVRSATPRRSASSPRPRGSCA